MQLDFSFRLLNAPGFLGFAPDRENEAQCAGLDAFVSNPISSRKRLATEKVGAYPAGKATLIHSGHPNPGFTKALELYRGKWERAKLPVILSLLDDDPKKIRKMVTEAEGIANVRAVQILLREDYSHDLMVDLCRAAEGELPVIAHVPQERCVQEGPSLIEAGAAAIAMDLARGEAQGDDGQPVRGRLVGSGTNEGALAVCQDMGKLGIAFIGGGGVYFKAQAQKMLDAGAMGVALDAVLWRRDWDSKAWS